jgi:hypothetical protein
MLESNPEIETQRNQKNVSNKNYFGLNMEMAQQTTQQTAMV